MQSDHDQNAIRLSHVLTGVACLLALAACGGGKGSDVEAPSSSPTAATPPAAAPSAAMPTPAPVDTAALSLTGDILATEGNTFSVAAAQLVQFGAGDRWVSMSVSGSVTCSATTFGADAAPAGARVCKSAAREATPVAKEGESFKVAGSQVVQYGAGGAWTAMTVSGTGTCSNGFFGTDPSPGVVKACQVTSTVASTLAVEGGSFTVAGTQVVQYGSQGNWVTKTVTGTASCASDFFGVNPIDGTTKVCVLATKSIAAATLGTEAGVFNVAGTQTVQYGAGELWASKTVSGIATCSAAFFGRDPAPGTVKTCRPAPIAFAGIWPGQVPSSPVLMPKVDASRIVAPVAGFSGPRITQANVADPSQNPAPSDIGDFREYCEYSHMNYDDPIVSPGKVGAHLHTFLGNTGTDRNSTAASIANSGNSTCAGGTLNRTAYWVPTVIDTTDGTPQAPLGSLIYYKQGYNYIASADIHPFPPGLRIVAGDPASSGPQGSTGFTCYKPDGSSTSGKSIPSDCPPGSTLTIGVAFPQCWDGVNLDSPDHRSHMAYPGFGCPASHPVAVTGITFNINYKVGANGTGRWRLSSDSYDPSLPGGYSTHADWFWGWDPAIQNTWMTRCINATMDCHAFLIGDGRILY